MRNIFNFPKKVIKNYKKLTLSEKLKLLGFVSIIGATFISMFTIRNIDRKISECDRLGIRYKDEHIQAILCKLDYSQLSSDRQIYLMHANLLVASKLDKDGKGIGEMRERAFKIGIRLANCWSKFLSNYGNSNIEVDQKKIFKIIHDRNMTYNKKDKKICHVVKINQHRAIKRGNNLRLQIQNNMSMKYNLEKNKSFWYFFFLLFQMAGLLLFTGSEILEKLFLRFVE